MGTGGGGQEELGRKGCRSGSISRRAKEGRKKGNDYQVKVSIQRRGFEGAECDEYAERDRTEDVRAAGPREGNRVLSRGKAKDAAQLTMEAEEAQRGAYTSIRENDITTKGERGKGKVTGENAALEKRVGLLPEAPRHKFPAVKPGR